jgi:type IV pilus assembly protein PilE
MKVFQKGFTLIELMITLGIVAILATIAYPAYNDYVIRSRRAEAKSALVTASQFLERRYSTQNTYLTSIANPTPFALPADMTCAPECGANQTHVIGYSTINPPTQTMFLLVATATGGQLAGEKRLKGCVFLTLDNFGQKRGYSSEDAATSTASAAEALNSRCW